MRAEVPKLRDSVVSFTPRARPNCGGPSRPDQNHRSAQDDRRALRCHPEDCAFCGLRDLYLLFPSNKSKCRSFAPRSKPSGRSACLPQAGMTVTCRPHPEWPWACGPPIDINIAPGRLLLIPKGFLHDVRLGPAPHTPCHPEGRAPNVRGGPKDLHLCHRHAPVCGLPAQGGRQARAALLAGAKCAFVRFQRALANWS